MATSAVSALLEVDALDACPLAVSVSDVAGHYLAVNAVCASVLGVDPARLEGVSDATLSPREFARALDANHRLALEGGQILETVEWVLDRVGRRRVAACRFALYGTDGAAWGVCRVSANVEHAGTVLQEAERLRALAVGQAPRPPVHAVPAPPDLPSSPPEEAPAATELQRLAAEAARLAELVATVTRERDAATVARAEAETGRREARAELARLAAELAAVTRKRDAALAAPASPAPSPSRPTDIAAALRALTRVAGGQNDIDSVLRAAAAPLGRELGWEVAAAWRMPTPTGFLHCAGAWSEPSAGLEVFGTTTWRAAVRPGTGQTGAVAMDGTPVWLTDLSPEDPCPRIAAAAQSGLRTAVIARVDGPKGPLGVVEVFSRAPRPYDSGALDAVVTAAELLGRIGALVAKSDEPVWGSRR